MRSFPFKYPLKNIFVYRIDFSDYLINEAAKKSLRFVRQPLHCTKLQWLAISDSSLPNTFQSLNSVARAGYIRRQDFSAGGGWRVAGDGWLMAGEG